MKQLVIWLSIFPLIFSTSDYLGCYKDGSPRDLLQRLHNNNVSVDNCVSGCRNLEYEYAAVQFSYLCFCGDHYGKFGKLPDEMCDSECKNAGDQYCGGDWKNSIYATGFKGKKKKHKKRDQVVLFDGPKEIKPSEFVEESDNDDVTATHRSDVTVASAHPRSEVPNSFDAPHVHINPTVYNQDNVPGSPGESISAFPLAKSPKSPPPLEQSASQTSTGQEQGPSLTTNKQPLEETVQGQVTYPGTHPQTVEATTGKTSPAPNIHVETIPPQTNSQQSLPEKSTPEISTSGKSTPELSTPLESSSISAFPLAHSKTGETIITIPALETSGGTNKAGTVLVKLSSKNLRLDGKDTKINSTVVNGTIIKINGTLYVVKGILTKLPKSAHANKLVGSLLADIALKNSNEHVVNASTTGVTTADGEMFSYDGISSTTLEDKPFDARVIKVKVKNKEQSNPPKKKLAGEKSLSVVSLTPIPTENNQKPSSATNDNQKIASSLPPLPPPPPPPPPTHSYYPPKPLQIPATSTDESSLSINKPLAAEAVGFQDTTSQDKQKKTACHIERKMAVNMDDSFVPVCQEDGSYAPVQCFEHAGFGKQCWCVNDKGEEIGDTRTTDGSTPTCEKAPKKQISSEVKYLKFNGASSAKKSGKGSRKQKVETHAKAKLSQCEAEKKISKNEKDMFSPECEPDGRYKSVQCFTHAHYGTRCWCVDESGKEISGSSVQGGDKPDCTKVISKALSSLDSHCGQYGCCADGKTPSPDPEKAGCPEKFHQEPKASERKVATTLHNKTAEHSHQKVACFEVTCGCCPDGVTVAMGPNFQGCGVQRPSVPKAKDVCASVILKQVWYDGLSNSYSRNYQNYANSLKKAITKIYSNQSDFGRVNMNGFEPGCYPYDPKSVNSVIAYFTLHFDKAVDRPLKPLQDYLDRYKTLGGKDVFPHSLMLTGIPENTNGCLMPTSPAKQPTPQPHTQRRPPPPPSQTPSTPAPPSPPGPQPPSIPSPTKNLPRPQSIPQPPTIPATPSPPTLPQPPAPPPQPPAIPATHSPSSPPTLPKLPAPPPQPPAIPATPSHPSPPTLPQPPAPPPQPPAIPAAHSPSSPPTLPKPPAPPPQPPAIPATHSPSSPPTLPKPPAPPPQPPAIPATHSPSSPPTLPKPPAPPPQPPAIPETPSHPSPPTLPQPPGPPPHPLAIPATPRPPSPPTLPNPSPTTPTNPSPTPPSPPNPPDTRLQPPPTSVPPVKPPTSSPSTTPLPDWDYLALYYTFDSHKFPFITDVSGHSNRGQMSAGVNVVGVQNGCGLTGSFIGGSITVDGGRFHPKPTQAVTIGLWVKFSSTEGEQTLFTTSRQGSYESNYYLASKAGKIIWCHKNEQGQNLFEIAASEPAVVVGQWAHIAATYDSSKGEAVIYVNSKEVSKVKAEGKLTQDWAGRTEIGSCNGHYPFRGSLDDFAIYTIALDVKTIAKLSCTCSMKTGSSAESKVTEQCHRGPKPPPTKATSNVPTTSPPPTSPPTEQPPTRAPFPTYVPPSVPPPRPPPPSPPLPPPGPIDGGYTSWSSWTGCTSSCGGGMQERIRNCTNPVPENGGKDCSRLGANSQTRKCNAMPCPVDGGFTDWSSFTQCTKTCGGGSQLRTRNCSNPTPQFGGKSCDHLGKNQESRKCNTMFCPVNGDYTEWSEWERCSDSCGGGKQFRSRTCNNPPAQYGGMNCDSKGPPREERICNTNLCPVDGGYSVFGNWSVCSVTCGGGNMTRTRACNNPAPAMGGKDCSQFGPPVEVMKCNEQQCPIDGGFTPFGEWSECSTTCGGGVQSRMRTCTNPTPQFMGKDCQGVLVETKMCSVQPCPVETGDGFGKWSECSVSCGGGVRSRSSECGNNPSCQPKTETQSCNVQPCPVPGGFTPWSTWGQCSTSCGTGIQQRTRTCTNPKPEHGGMGCELLGPSLDMRNCTLKECPVNGGYSDWTYWTQCSVTCGGGIKTRYRNCSSPEPAFGGKDCAELGVEVEKSPCAPDRCPVSGGYSEWGDWTNCTAKCGSGEQFRTRTCTNPVPEFGGNDCTLIGESTEKRECNKVPCPVPGGYTMWSNWTECSSTCNEGVQYRERQCTNPTPQHGGKDCLTIGPATDQRSCFIVKCPELRNETEYTEWSECTKTCGMGIQSRASKNGEQTQSRFCNTEQCPVDGGYSLWSEWSDCSATCGGGISTRRRSCTFPEPQFNGKDCLSAVGPDVETKPCMTDKCPVPKVPIRSCLEYKRRCHANVDGVYTIINMQGDETLAYCDMTKDAGGWTLLVTSRSKTGWDDKTVLLRNEKEPSITNDYSILKYADGIKGISTGGFEFRLESSERGSNGGIWKAPQGYSFTKKDNSQVKILDVSKFGSWKYGKESLGQRMPWLSSGNSLLTTSEGKAGEEFGSIISKNTNAPSWIKDTDPNPTVIWYWMRESPGPMYEEDPTKKDKMCPKPVDGGYTEWSLWSSCTKSCDGGTQIRTRNCTLPSPIDGGLDCADLGIGGDEESRKCNTLVCPGEKVDGGYSDWSAWSACTVTCGGGSRMRNRKCNNPAPANDGKTCFDQQLGSEMESEACNIEQCEGLCEPKCQNGGQCVGKLCQCTDMYEGKSCEKAICKKKCLNGGLCIDPFKNLCRCKKGFCGLRCEKSGQACQLFEFYFRITNLAKKNVVFISSDGVPGKGSSIGARRIVEIRKKTLSRIPVTFQVKSGNNLLLLNAKPGITLLPGKSVKQPLSLTITESIPQKLYFTNLRVTNLAKTNIVLKASDNIPVKGFNIKSNVIAEITKKTANPKEILFQAFDASSNKALWVNGKQSFGVKPTETKGLPLSLIIKATVPVVKMFYIVMQVTNLARTDVLLFPNDRKDSILVKNNVIVLIKMTTQQSTAVTFKVMDAKTREPYYINGASSIGIVPKLIADTPEALTITRSADDIKASTYYLEIQVINKTPRKIILIPDDNEPAQGFALGPKTISLITKTVRAKQPVIFKAIDAESDGELRINEQSNVSLVPTISKEHIESLTVTSESGDEDTGQPQIEPYYFWSFLTIVNGKIPGHLPFNVLGHVEVVDGGVYFDGLTAFLGTQLVPNNILANPDTAKEGLAFGIKMKFDGTAKEYDIPRYVLDTGATSGGNTGVSLYVLNGKLIAEIATPVMKWKAEITLIYDQWFYIIVNWKFTSGLVIAFNGFPKSSDRKGSPVSGLQPSTKNPNFCLGRNVGGTGFYYTKFYLASLVVFKEYLSDSLIYPVYSYYRINVLVQPSKLYFANLKVLNKYSGTIEIKFSDNVPPNGFLLKSNIVANIKKKTNSPTAITIHAEDPVTKKPLYVNDLPKLRVTPSQFEEQVTTLVVSTKSGIGGTTLFQPVGCFNDRRNPRPLPEMLQNFQTSPTDLSSFNNTIMKCALLAKKKNYKYFGVQGFSECWSGPSADSSYAKDGKSLQCSNGVGKANAIYVYRFGGQDVLPSSMYYLAANIYNKYGKPIILKSSDNQPADQIIPANGVAQLTKDIPNQTPVLFEAFDASSPTMKLSMNNRKGVSITPSTVKGAPHTVVIKEAGTSTGVESFPSPISTSSNGADTDILTSPWNIMLTIVNKVDRDIILFSSDNDPPQGFKIKRGYIVTLSKILSSRQNIRFLAIEDQSRAKVLLNDKEWIETTAKQGTPTPVAVTLTAFKGGAVSTEENKEAVAVEAPPVAARHSWIFTSILNGIIPGDVHLSVHGKTVAKEGVTIFDGVTSWLSATLHSTDCLLAPANCRDGLSVGFKIRFNGLVKFPEERYIVDTGVLSKGTRGIAIYLQDGQLFCVVMTMTAQWKLGMIVPRDRWIFIGISWSENQGLYLYNGGKLISQTKIKTPQNQVPISNASPNFVFGRSLAGTGFARFELASFSTFTTFLAPSAMRPVFTYYWRIGLSRPTDGKTFIDIKISNRAGKDIVLMSSDKMPLKGMTIIKGVMLDFVKQFTGATKVTFTAKDAMTGQLIYLNGKKSLTLEASSVRGRKITIFATTKPGQISTETSQYYFVLKVLNKAGSDIFVKCTDGVPKRGFAIKKGFIVVITKLTNSVTPVGFSASDIHGKPVLLNGQSHLTLTPSTVKREPMKITVQNAQASGASRFYIGLKLLNKAGSDVILKSSDRNPEAGFKIKQGLVVKIIKTVASNQPVMFTALDAKGGKVILNNKMNIILKPSPIKGQPFTVAMTPAAGSKVMPVYFTSMKVINKHSSDIVIKSSDNYPPKGYTIKPNNIAIITKKSSSSMPITYSVFDVKTNKLVAVNQHSKVTIRPHLVRGQPVNLLIGGAMRASKKTEVERPQASAGTQPPLPIYYLVLKIANRAGFDATIIPGDSQPPQFQVRKGYLEIVTKKSHSDKGVVFKAIKTGTNEVLSINGKDDVFMSPTRTKGKPIELVLRTKENKIQDEKLKPETKSPFYVNLHVSNQSPSETVFFPVKDSPESGFHLNPGTAMNIKETVDSGSPVTYMALRGDNHKPLLLNNQNRLTVTPDKKKTLNAEVNITTPGDANSLQKDCHIVSCSVPKPPKVPDRFITLILHNKLGRAARVVPSKGKHKNRGYVVGPHSFVKVNIIIKGEKYVEPITFRGEDLETQSNLLLNKALFPISLTPSDTSDASTNISVTAEAPHAKPLQSWSFSSFDGSSVPGSPSLSVHGSVSPAGDGLHFDGSTSSMDTYIEGSHCLIYTDFCSKGFSFGTKLKLDKIVNGYTEPRFILDTGGHGKNTRGVALFVENKKLVAEVTTKNKRYRAATPLVLDQWIYVIMTFKQGLGLSLYYDAQLRSMDNTGTPVPNTHPVDTDKNLLIGRNIEGPPYQYAAFSMASLTVFEEYLHEDDVNRVFLFFWSGKSAKIYYATLHIINGAGRPAILKPNRGQDKGFAIKPNSTQRIRVMSMSTDDNPIEPVEFHAIDAETSSKLMINHFIRPFVVVPKKSKKQITTIWITSPAPSILPKYIWNFKHVDVGVIRDSEPKLMVHGLYEPEEDSLRLLPGDTWIDAGDFRGLCISDTQMCDEGMAMAIKLKFNDEAKNYTDEPRFILDSGAHDPQSRGFSLHLQNGKLSCVVSISNGEWKVSTPISLHEWKYVMFTWKKTEGLSLYVNGHLKDQMKHLINKPGLHHTDKLTHFEIARNIAGPPYGHAQFTINSLAFFDEHLSKADALREYIYYWGNAVPAFSNRYIKVRFDNKAGTNVRITPSKGGAKDQGYSIKPHMSLELSFVAKGTSANVPVTFRAQDELSGDSLLINTSEEPFAVSPSDSSTHMNVATVTSSVKCLSPNGLFPDPTNEFGYINCTAGSAKRVPCEIGMKWEDETKSCQRKGGLPTLYYATLQLHNNVGKDIELLESDGKEPAHLLTKGEARKIKLIGHEIKHYKFEAIDNSTGEALVLNNQAFASVSLGEDPDRVMEVTISKPSHFYTVVTHTGTQPDAGTTANVLVQLIGKQGRTEELPLKHAGTKEFQPGQIDKFRVPALDIGKIIKVKVKHDGSGKSPSWYLNKVTVKDDDQHSYEFPLYGWLRGLNSETEPAERQLLLYHGTRTCVPSCKNGGECIGGVCKCPSSFEGVSCEKTLCPIPCKNGGECVNPTSNECRCPQGFQGQYCENAICTSRCLNGGICVGPNRCTCLPAYSGLTCEISSCKPDCINGGICKGTKCECSPGYSGEYCQVEHTCELPLETGPCLHELKREMKEGKSNERSESCSKYLNEVLNNCQVRGSTYTQKECEKQCDPTTNIVCSRIWNPAKCQTDTKRFRFNAQTRTCDQFMFSGCLGNRNNFATESTCNQACSTDIRKRKRRDSAVGVIDRFLKRPL